MYRVILEKWENAKRAANTDHPHNLVPYLWKSVGDHSIDKTGFANQSRVHLVDGPRAATIASHRGGGTYHMSLDPVSCSCGRLYASGVPCYHLVAYCYATSKDLCTLALPVDSVSLLPVEPRSSDNFQYRLTGVLGDNVEANLRSRV